MGVATLIGANSPVGVVATPNLEEAVAADSDVVIHLTRDFGRYDSIPAIERFQRIRNVPAIDGENLRTYTMRSRRMISFMISFVPP